MRLIWLCGLTLALSGCVSASDGDTYFYNDIRMPHGRPRDDATRQAATRACDGGDSAKIGLKAFNRCMLKHGWAFDHIEKAADDDADDDSDLSMNPTEEMDDRAASDEYQQQIQQSVNEAIGQP